MTVRADDQGVRVEQKWGFGMAPVKRETQLQRQHAAAAVLDLLNDPDAQPASCLLDELSIIKGLYSRSCKQDQWDWFTVWQQLGRPSRKRCHRAVEALVHLRVAVKQGDWAAMAEQAEMFRGAGGKAQLDGFVNGRPSEPQNVGYIYVLSTREQPRLLKIGYTERSVEERVKEINRATGVIIPYGVRAVWAVAQARAVEAELHARLARYRVRKDREFFNLHFQDAHDVIEDYICQAQQESCPEYGPGPRPSQP